VDDEKLELETLRDYMDWKSMGISPVYIARNGKDAYDKVMDLRPDIMITDIHMPAMNGVELSQKLYEERSKTKIIFLTGYDDFEYVKAAFQVDAIDYILKPFSIEAIQNAMKRVCQVLDREQLLQQSVKDLERKLLQAIFNKSEETRKPAVEQLRKLKNNQQEMLQFGMIQAIGNTEKIDCEEIEGKFSEVLYAVKEEGRVTFLALYFVDFWDSTKRIAKYYETLGVPAIFLYNTKKWSIDQLYISFNKYGDYSSELFYESSNAIVEVENSFLEGTDEKIETEKEIEASMETADIDFIKKEMKKTKDMLQHEKTDGNFDTIKQYCLEQIKDAKRYKLEKKRAIEKFSLLFTDIYETFVEDNKNLKESMPRRSNICYDIYLAVNIDAIENVFIEYLQLIQEYLKKNNDENGVKDKNVYVMQCVKRFIIQNFANVITIEAIAEEIGLSPNYVRNIFKEKTGMTITEWITEYRLEEACLLLKNNKLKVKQISNMVGYENDSYFCSVFAKKFGVSPKEYQNRLIRS